MDLRRHKNKLWSASSIPCVATWTLMWLQPEVRCYGTNQAKREDRGDASTQISLVPFRQFGDVLAAGSSAGLAAAWISLPACLQGVWPEFSGGAARDHQFH